MRYNIIRFKLLAHMLLMQHVGVTLSDTVLCDDEAVKDFIEQGVSPVEAFNKIGIPIDISKVPVSY
ncbi:TA system toxin CbtA family protein [Xenorhabdus indica]|uniref:TA system toxin CbtA family protein n=1 Tax=Xenorhabdus indica TaxID=333964 RepID=UPI00165744C5|nr:TA system toxin CbtA family protein [Xenorhabdus indica]MBC8946521.1 toxin-antitoxin protein [Xenorhabdus indica]